MRKSSLQLLVLVLLVNSVCIGQLVIRTKLDKVSLHHYSSIANVGQQDLSIQDIISDRYKLEYTPIQLENQNIGFTRNNYWVKISLVNDSNEEMLYYLEVARPVTDHVDLYTVDAANHISEQHTGDDLEFSRRSFDHRKSIFIIKLPARSTSKLFIHIKSDGEVLTLPLILRSSENLLHITYLEQLVFGLFYGILLLAAIIYLFFYVGMRDQSFLYYSLYVLFIALMQFSLDGYFYEYVSPGGGWFSLHSVLIFATIAAFLLGKYAELFLNIKIYIPLISRVFRVIYILLAVIFLALVCIPQFLPLGYPMANLFGLIVLGLIVYSIFYLNIKNLPIDKFFTIGILFLVSGFVVFILNNFNLIPTSFLSQNSSKFGTGLEVIFISLSMANRIRKLREEREKLIDNLTISNQDLKQFTYITSHNLRAPISNLLGLMSLYDRDTISNPRNIKVIQKISESTERLNETVNDLINILLIKNNPEIEQSNVKFEDILDHCVNAINLDIEKSGAMIHSNFSAADHVYFNKNYLESIFQNLLTNAIRYRSATRPLIIDIKTRIKDHAIQLLFSDNGSGINLERHKEKIFGMHQRFHSNTDSKGVGLYIIKSQINSLGGNITIESDEGVGTTFIVTFKK